jgi:hypothetical protein
MLLCATRSQHLLHLVERPTIEAMSYCIVLLAGCVGQRSCQNVLVCATRSHYLLYLVERPTIEAMSYCIVLIAGVASDEAAAALAAASAARAVADAAAAAVAGDDGGCELDRWPVFIGLPWCRGPFYRVNCERLRHALSCRTRLLQHGHLCVGTVAHRDDSDGTVKDMICNSVLGMSGMQHVLPAPAVVRLRWLQTQWRQRKMLQWQL